MAGLREFEREGKTSDAAYSSMRRLYRTTNGRFNDMMGTVCRAFHPKRAADLSQSIFSDVTKDEIKQASIQLRRDGCYQFARRLPATYCQSLLNFSLQTPGMAVTLDGGNLLQIFDRRQPQAVRHQFQPEQLFLDPVVQTLTTDPYFFAIAQEYLGFNPVQDLLSMWWSAPQGRVSAGASDRMEIDSAKSDGVSPDAVLLDEAIASRAAQLYHFDMDRFKFVKFFVYLTEVGTNNGPHCYVRGSHLRKPAALLRDERISDREIEQHYRAEDLLELTGPVGTILAVDTRGFHKGKPLLSGDRLIFQLQFSDSLFGQNYPSIAVGDEVLERTCERLASNRRCYANFDLSGRAKV